MQTIFYDYDFGITCIDTMYSHVGHTACYLVVHNGCAAFIDTGTGNTVPYLLKILEIKGIPIDKVEYVAPTHVHLDHAGGAGLLMSKLPNANLVIHPRGARHMTDPSKLIISAMAVYGEKKFKRNFGEIIPIDEKRIIVAEDKTTLVLAGRKLTFLDTPGHARHHFCIYDETSKSFFSGDTFGLSYRQLDDENGAFILPTTSPVQFDPNAWQESLTRILSYNPENIYITHFGKVTEISHLAGELCNDISQYAKIAQSYAGMKNRKEKIYDALRGYLQARLNERYNTANVETQMDFLESDLRLNAAGLDVWVERLQKAD